MKRPPLPEMSGVSSLQSVASKEQMTKANWNSDKFSAIAIKHIDAL